MAKPNIWMKIGGLVAVIALGWFGWRNVVAKGSATPSYTTGQVTKGTLIVAVSGSGSVSSTNSVPVDTLATGVVNHVYVTDGQKVTMGQKIADLTLDMPGQQRQAAASAAYQTAKNNLATSQNGLYSTQSDMLTQWNTYYNLATNSYYQDSSGTPQHRTEPAIVGAQDTWLAAEAKYQLQQNVVAQAQTALSSSWLSYQQSAATIVAPINGTIDGLSIIPNSVIASGSLNSNGIANSVKIANVVTAAQPLISVTLTELDIPKVKSGDKATITFTSQPNVSYTGTVMSVDTVGAVASGVTSYPVIIELDAPATNILPNMTAQANIITMTKENVLLVPSAAVQTVAGATQVRVVKNGAVSTVPVTVGEASDTETEITSGLSEGDTVVTSAPTTTSGSSQSSIFSTLGGARGFGGGGGVRVNTRGG